MISFIFYAIYIYIYMMKYQDLSILGKMCVTVEWYMAYDPEEIYIWISP